MLKKVKVMSQICKTMPEEWKIKRYVPSKSSSPPNGQKGCTKVCCDKGFDREIHPKHAETPEHIRKR